MNIPQLVEHIDMQAMTAIPSFLLGMLCYLSLRHEWVRHPFIILGTAICGLVGIYTFLLSMVGIVSGLAGIASYKIAYPGDEFSARVLSGIIYVVAIGMIIVITWKAIRRKV
jgi:hypothetical protein